MNEILDTVALVLVLIGGLLCVTAAIGLLRFHDVPTRLHAATKPQVFGLVLVLSGVMLTLRTPQVVGLCMLTIALQIITAPVAGHMLARTAYRTGQWDEEEAVVDDLGRDLAEAGFAHADDVPADEPPPEVSGGGR